MNHCWLKGSARRKKKVLHKTTVGDDKKLQTSLKKLGLNPIPSIEEVCFCFKFSPMLLLPACVFVKITFVV